MAAPKTRAGGKGSNQYATKPAALPSGRIEAMRDRVSAERAANAFASDPIPAPATVDTPSECVTAASHPDPKVRSAAAAKPACPPELLVVLGDDTESDVRRAVIRNAFAPTAAVMAVISHPSGTNRFSAAQRNDLPPEAFPVLIQETPGAQTTDIHALVANHPLCPPEILDELADSPHLRVVRSVIENPNTPTDSLRRIAKRSDGSKTLQREAARAVDQRR